jgi:hypothetical protein
MDFLVCLQNNSRVRRRSKKINPPFLIRQPVTKHEYFGGWILIQEREEKGSFMGDDIVKIIGLSEAEAALRLKTERYNELPSSKSEVFLPLPKKWFLNPCSFFWWRGRTLNLNVAHVPGQVKDHWLFCSTYYGIN